MPKHPPREHARRDAGNRQLRRDDGVAAATVHHEPTSDSRQDALQDAAAKETLSGGGGYGRRPVVERGENEDAENDSGGADLPEGVGRLRGSFLRLRTVATAVLRVRRLWQCPEVGEYGERRLRAASGGWPDVRRRRCL